MPASWRTHPRLQGRFHPDFPDDIQVIVHDGGPRLSRAGREIVWVRVTDGEGDLFAGTLLNQPVNVTCVSAGDSIQFIVPESGKHPLLVTEKYLLERPDWVIHPCSRCGLTELFDAPSDLIRVVFPPLSEAGPAEVPVMFTAFCGCCGGVQVVERAGTEAPEGPAQARESWWEVWRSRVSALLRRRGR
jgi:hypothetical protein